MYEDSVSAGGGTDVAVLLTSVEAVEPPDTVMSVSEGGGGVETLGGGGEPDEGTVADPAGELDELVGGKGELDDGVGETAGSGIPPVGTV